VVQLQKKKKEMQAEADEKADDAKRAAKKARVAAKMKVAKQLKEKKKKAMESLVKKKKRADKLALAGIPDQLYHTGTTKMKLSNMRAAQRLKGHFLNAKKRLFRVQGRAFERLQRSAGGTAARHAAEALRKITRDKVLKYEVHAVSQQMANRQKLAADHERELRDDYAQNFRALERKDQYAFALRRLVASSWWGRLYKQSMEQADAKCQKMKGSKAAHCRHHVLQNHAWLAKHLRSQDAPFKKAYAAFSKEHAEEREGYLAKRNHLSDDYQKALDHMRANVEAQVVDHQRAVEGKLMRGPADPIAKDLENATGKEDAVASRQVFGDHEDGGYGASVLGDYE